MTHYIDAEKIIAFLKKEKAEHIIGGDYSDGVLDTCDNMLNFIDSLQQEQPDVGLENEIENEWRKCHPTDEGMGLESANIVKEQFDAIAYHFYELDKNTRKE